MAEDIKRVGLEFTAEGVSDFKSQLQAVTQASQENYKAFKKAKEGYDAHTSASKKLGDKQKYLASQTETYKKKVEVLSSQLEEMESDENANEKAIAKKRAALEKAKGTLSKYESQLEEVNQSLANITTAVEKGIITQTLIDRVEELEQQRSDLQTRLYNLHLLETLKYKDFSHLINDFQNMQRGTEEFRTFVQSYIDKIVTFPYHIEIYLNVGFGVTNELKETITIRRGELYALFESKTNITVVK